MRAALWEDFVVGFKTLCAVLALSVLALFTHVPGAAVAQNVIEALREQGYSRIRITKQTFTRLNFEACQGGVRYLVKMRGFGNVRSKQKIGECRRAISEQQAERILRDEGFRRIRIRAAERGFGGSACRRGERFEVFVNRFGDVRPPRSLGPCQRQALSPEQVRKKLRDQGYNRIKFTDRELPRYVAEACRRDRRWELVLSRRGEIRDERRIGRCQPPIAPEDIAKVLSDKGYDRVKVVDNRLPRYVAEACKADERMEVTLNRFGAVRDEIRIGRCQRALNPKQFIKVLRDRGYTRIRYRGQDGTDYLVRACINNKRYRARFSQFGEALARREAGPCRTPSLDSLAKRFRDRGVERISFYVEGCRRGVRYRTRVDAFGDPISRKRIGSCN